MIATSLQIITQQLTAIAPRIVEFSLNNGATRQDIERLETRIGKNLPDDFKELYTAYNGMNDQDNWGNFFYGMTFFSIDDMIAGYEFRSNQSKNSDPIPLKSFDPQIDGSDLYNSNWVPIGSDGSRCSLLIDLAPAEKGSYGQIIFIDGTYDVGILVANSTAELAANFAADLQNNLYFLEPDALEDGQHFLETAPGIDLVNWFNIDKWKHLAGN